MLWTDTPKFKISEQILPTGSSETSDSQCTSNSSNLISAINPRELILLKHVEPGTKRKKLKSAPKRGRPVGGVCIPCNCNGAHTSPQNRSPRKHEKCKSKTVVCLFPGCDKMFARVDNMRQHCGLCHDLWD
ncbi:hypothetical protein HK096_008925 [Nowakowskiella sp. JEL0078]|nr:hypothetical protein HK096_008925 [Nowakowskiella sp. JEL0078]